MSSKNERVQSLLNASSGEFYKEYKKLYNGKAECKDLYQLLLMELRISTSEGNLDKVKKLIYSINCISAIEDEETLKYYYDSEKNPLKNTNLVILSCKHDKLQILRFVHNSTEILRNLSVGVGKDNIMLDDVDEMNHNSVYYAIRSCNVELLDTLIVDWLENYFDHNFDEILSTAYEELKLRNVTLSNEIEIFVESKLIDSNFFSDSSEQVCTINDASCIRDRVMLVLEKIDLLRAGYLESEVDERFLFVAKFLAQNIHVLKRQMRSTYKQLPWEEIEFCLVSYVASLMKKQELNFYNHAVLNKKKILSYLESFAKKLAQVIKSVNVSKYLPKLKREEIMTKIIRNNPEFEDLYNSYQKVRDIYSLEKMNSYMKLALAADPKEREGQLIITRVLLVVGEYLKNTLESPKLSNATSQHLVLSLPKDTIKVIIDLRNSFSHALALSKRVKIEKDTEFFVGVQNDAKKVGDVITSILYFQKLKVITTLFKKILDCESLEEIKDAVNVLNNSDLDSVFNVDFKLMEHKQLEKLLNELRSIIPSKIELPQFDIIKKILSSVEESQENTETDYLLGFSKLKSICYKLNDNDKFNNYTVTGIKFSAATALKYITPKTKSHNLEEILVLLRNILDNIKFRVEQDKVNDVYRILWEIYSIIEYSLGEIKWIEELRAKLKDKSVTTDANISMTSTERKNLYDNWLKFKLTELECILSSNVLGNQSSEFFSMYKNNSKLQSVVEMLVLDIMSILDSKNILENNLLLLDNTIPLLTGKCLRNHLAHYNDLIDLMLSDPSIAVILNAKKLTTENIFLSNKKIGMPVKNNVAKLEDKFNQNLLTLSTQKDMFSSIEKGNLELLNSLVSKGADIYARNLNLWNSVHFAAKGSNLEIVKLILKQNCNANTKDINGQNPLHIAAAYGRSDIADYFVNNVCLYVDEVDCNGKTSLHIAAQHGHKDTAIVLLQHKANIFKHDKSGLLPLHYAIRNGHVNVVKILLENNTNIDRYEAMGGFSPLHVAAEAGNIELINFFLSKGANVNIKNDRGWTPLHAASRNGYPDVLNALIINGADVNARVINGCTSLQYAVETGQETVVDILLKYNADVNAFSYTDHISSLHRAAMNGHSRIVKTLIKHKAGIDVTDIDGMTPLHLAAQFGWLEAVSELLQYHIDINAKSKTNYTPLHYAAIGGHKEIVALLVKNKAEVNIKTDEGFSPLHMAACKGHQYIIEILLENKAEVDAETIEGATPLHMAVECNNKHIIKLLIENKADINFKTNRGIKPIDIAALKGNENTLVLLIENKADVNSKDKVNITPLHRAAIKGHKKIIDILIYHKADVNAKDVKGLTPLLMAIGAGFKDIVKKLISAGARINSESELVSPLYFAVRHKCTEIVEILISNGANINANGDISVQLAVCYGFKDIVEIFIKNGININAKYNDNITLLHLAVFQRNLEVVNMLIMNGADVNALDMHKETPLYFAANCGFDEIVEILIKKHANVKVKNDEGFTLLHIAAAKGHIKVVKVLLDNKMDITQKDSVDRTPVELAASFGHLEIVKMLFQDKKININAKGSQTWTLLHIAVQGNNLELIKYLIDRGSNINATNRLGTKPIHVAAKEGYIDSVKFFLSKGSNINDLGHCNQTLLHYASIHGKIKMIKFLTTQGADINAKDCTGATPLHIAANLGHKMAVTVLLQNGAFSNIVNNSHVKPIDSTRDFAIITLLALQESLIEAVKVNRPTSVLKFIKMGAIVNAKTNANTSILHYAAWKGYFEIVGVLLGNKSNPNEVGIKGYMPLHYAAKFSHLNVVKVLLCSGAMYDSVCHSGKTPLDISEDEQIASLLKLIGEIFQNIKDGNAEAINKLNEIKDRDTVKAIMNARDRENRSLIVVAVQSDYANVEKLKDILQGDVSSKIKEAIILLNEDKYKKSLNILEAILVKRKKILGSDNPGTLDIQVLIAKVWYKQGAFELALYKLTEVFKLQKEILGLNSKDTLCTRSLIALILFKQEKDEEALQMCQDIFPRQKEILGPNHTDTLDTQLYMALILNKLGRYEEALKMNQDVYNKRKESNHPNALLAQNNIAMVLSNQGKMEEALQMYYEVLEKKKKMYGTNNSDTIRTMLGIATVLLNQKNYHDALRYLEELFSIQETVLGLNHPDTLATQHSIANVLYAQGKWNDAFKCYKNVLAQIKCIFGANHPSSFDVLRKIEGIKFSIMKIQGGEDPDELENILKDIHSAGDLYAIPKLTKNKPEVIKQDSFGGLQPSYYVGNEIAEVYKKLTKK